MEQERSLLQKMLILSTICDKNLKSKKTGRVRKVGGGGGVGEEGKMEGGQCGVQLGMEMRGGGVFQNQ